MSDVRNQLADYGHRLAEARLAAGAGGNISARDGEVIWMKPSGFAMGELKPVDLVGIRIEDGSQIAGEHAPTSEVNLHLAVYRCREDVGAVFHTHSPWATGVISAGVELRPVFAEVVSDLGRMGTLNYLAPSSRPLAEAVGDAVADYDTLLLVNHGVVVTGAGLRQAFFRAELVEHAAIAMVAAATVGRPQFLSTQQVDELHASEDAPHRAGAMER